MAFTEDTLEFTVTAPSWRDGTTFTHTCKWFRTTSIDNNPVPVPNGNGGTHICYPFPGDTLYMGTIRFEESVFSDAQDALLNVLETNGCTGTLVVTPGADHGTRNVRNAENISNVFLESVSVLAYEQGASTYAYDLTLIFRKLTTGV